jgi:hypothetical protein
LGPIPHSNNSAERGFQNPLDEKRGKKREKKKILPILPNTRSLSAYAALFTCGYFENVRGTL